MRDRNFALGWNERMNAPERIRLTEFSHGGGCGCKIAPAVLSELLAATPIRGLPKDTFT